MQRSNPSGSRVFAMLSLLSTGLTIVAAGLLVDYSSQLVNQSHLFEDTTEGAVAVSAADRQVTPVSLSAVFSSRLSDPTAAYRSTRIDHRGEPAYQHGIGASLLLDVLRDEIAQRRKMIDESTRMDLIVLKPSAPDIEIGNNISDLSPQPIDVLRGTVPEGRGG